MSSGYFAAEVSEKDISRIQNKLGEMRDKTPVVVARALNRTASNARTQLAKQAGVAYTYKKSTRTQMRLKKATPADLGAEIRSSGSPHNLTSFQHGFYKRAGAHAAVIRGQRKYIRSGDGTIKGFKTMSRGGAGGLIMIRKGEKRRPVHVAHGPSTPKMLENEKVYGIVEPSIQENLNRHIDSRIKELLAR